MRGAATLAAAVVLCPAFVPSLPAATVQADAVVLVNSESARYLDFKRQIQPYLDNFGFPYAVRDIATNAPGESLTNYAVIIIGHSQLDTNYAHLTDIVQSNISLAVSRGVGLVNFDNDLSAAGVPRYQFVQDIFGFAYGTAAAAGSATLPATEPSGQMHFITARHPTNDTVLFRSTLTLPGLTLPASTTPLVRVAGQPLVAVAKYGDGRGVQWGSYGWMASAVLGPADGLDDVVWRGVVWAARKPFVMRGLPHFVTMRVDDVDGPLDWVHAANAVGFKPFLSIMISNVTAATAADLRGMVTNGNATASVHSFTDTGFFYFNHQLGVSNLDTVQSNYFYLATQWHASHGIPISKVCATHYSEIGPNCFAGLKAWGIEFIPIEVVPGTVEYAMPGAAWLVGGPYRLYETPQPGQVNWPTYYADWLSVPGHPEFDSQFFNIYSEMRDLSACGEWCPDNDVAGSINRGTAMLKRSLDSMVMATLFSHEWYIHPTLCCGTTTITSNNWRLILQGITNNLAGYRPDYVTLDHASQYVRATRISRLVNSEVDVASGQVTVNLSGRADLDTGVYIFVGADTNITSTFANVPAFASSSNITVALSDAPRILTAPSSRTNDAGTTAVFSAGAGGAWPLSYRWYRNGTNALADGGKVSGAGSATLVISNVLGGDAGNYSVTVTNSFGSVTSAAPAVLAVRDPVILVPPVSQNVAAGATVSFYVAAVGTALTYQWLRNGAPINDATNASLSLTNVSAADSGGYSATVNSAYGSILSSDAALAVYHVPTAVNDNYGVTAGATLAVAAPGILGNDTVVGGGSLGATLASGPSSGTLSLNADGGFTYAPLTNHVGTDSFTYEAVNGPIHSTVATVTLSTTQSGVLFSDGFARLTDPGPLSPWVANAGTWTVTGAALQAGTNAFQTYGNVYLTNIWANYSVEGRVRFSSTNAWGGGIGGRLEAVTGAHYGLWVYPDGSPGGSSVLRLIKFRTWTSFGYNGSSGVPMKEISLTPVGTNWHTLKLAFHGSQIAAYYDGTQAMSVTDTEAGPYISGGISVDLWTALAAYTMSVSDMVVRPLVADDHYDSTRNRTLEVSSPGVLGNDTGVYATGLEVELVSGATNGTLNLSSDGGFTYRPASNYYGTDNFSYQASQGPNVLGTASVSISIVPDVPIITRPPSGQTNSAGTTAVLSIEALGILPLSYQWYRDGTIALSDGARISGARSATLAISNVMGSDAGSYTVVVTNAPGSVTSTPPALLTVLDPIITTDPMNQTNEAGGDAVFRVGVTGTMPLTYQWFRNKTNALTDGGKISGARRSKLTISNVMGGDSGSYTVAVLNAFGGATNVSPGLLTVIDPIITNQPVNQTNAAGTTASFSVGAYGTSPSYQWLKGGAAIAGATGSLLTLPAVSAADAGSYRVVVSNMYGSLTSQVAELAFVPALRISSVQLGKRTAVVTWGSVRGQIYRLQYKNNLVDPVWKDAVPDVLATSVITALTNTIGLTPQRYFRVTGIPAVVSRPRITRITVTNGAATIVWSSVLNQTYRLEYKGSLAENTWSNVAPDVTAVGPTTTVSHFQGNPAGRFYRVRVAP